MVFGYWLRFVTKAAPSFGPFNCVSNMVLRTAIGAMPKEGSSESVDGSELVHFLRGTKGDISTPKERTMGELQGIYVLCFGGRKGIHG